MPCSEDLVIGIHQNSSEAYNPDNSSQRHQSQSFYSKKNVSFAQICMLLDSHSVSNSK